MPTTGQRDFEEYARARQHRLYRTAYLLCGDADRAQDLTQTTLAKLFQHWKRASRADNLDAYAKTVLSRTFLAEQRGRRRERGAFEVDDTPTFVDHHSDLRLTLLAALATLPPKPRVMVILRYWEDLSVEHVAALMRCSPGNVKSQCARSMAKLRAELGELHLYATES
ncbi:SigE family RNA polymerase sigma factor [Streptomyces sp. SID3343]|uniref:SigE family RNA polymerase sigma factor n=1 Tax=Streptomyces sp. SID3343 TaxID=2690260 RepID=UPI00136B0C51|nr:SigE family RNA polymerase sigma factor [Streptomyces sp. SID3343]MYV97614.1 SigE family RNA polymerase sigma factor [Streptomyces sp. SID3343]